MSTSPIPLPVGATLVDPGSMKLPPGASLAGNGPQSTYTRMPFNNAALPGHVSLDEQGEESTPEDRAKNSAYDKLPASTKLKLMVMPGAMDTWSKQFYGGKPDPHGDAAAYGKVIQPTLGQMSEGFGDVMEGNIAQGGHKILKSGSLMALPFIAKGLPAAAVAEPSMIARAIAGGYLGQKAAQGGAQMLGANQDQQDFAGDIGNITGGTAASMGMLRALLGSPTKALLGKTAGLSDIVDPEITGLVSPRLAHLQRLLMSAGKIASKSAPEATAAGPIPAGDQAPSANQSILPNATYLQPEMRALTSAKTRLPDEINKNTNTPAQEYFIQKMRDQMNRQTVTGSAEQDAAIERMNEYAKNPWDKMQGTASGPVEAEQGGHAGGGVSSVEELSRPGTNYVVSPSGTLSYHGKAFAPESTPNGASHVTALPDGTLRVNAGPKLSAAQEMSLRKALPNQTPRVPTSEADMMQLLSDSLKKYGKKKSAAAGGDD